jgi:hypothetical protein
MLRRTGLSAGVEAVHREPACSVRHDHPRFDTGIIFNHLRIALIQVK